MGAPRTTGSTRDETTGRVLPAGRWRVVPERSRIGFRVKKMGIYYVKGRFSRVEGTLDQDGRGEVVIDASSISTRIPPRDWHLRSVDFLAVRRHPEIRARVESIEPADDGGVVAAAVFDLHGERGPVALHGHFRESPDAGRNGAGRLLLHLQGTLDRREFAIRARPPFEWIVGRDVLLDVELALERISGEAPIGEAPHT
jgi:polyisoprenoid-binding protein YceI